MQDVNWDDLYYDLTNRYQCSGYDIRKKPLGKLMKRRKKIKEIIEKAKDISSTSPEISKEDFRSEMEAEFIPGLFTTILLSIFSVMIKYIIEYIIDQLYPETNCIE